MAEAKVALIDLQPRSITLQKGRDPGFFEGSYSLSLTNSRGVPFGARIEIRPEGETKAEWISIPKERLLFDFPADKTQPIPIAVRVPEAAAGKRLSFTVKVMDNANPDELYDTQGATMVVPAAPVPTHGGGGLPRWLIPVIVGVVLLLGGVGFAVYKLTSGPKLGSTCDPAAPKCPAGVTCDAAKKMCLAKVAEACEKDTQCLTGHCDGGKCGPLALGEECDPAQSLCGANATCSDLKKCQGNKGADCTKAEDCVTGVCDAAKKCSALALHGPCDPQRVFCDTGLECPPAVKTCLASLNQSCTTAADCATNNCTNQKCALTARKAGDACSGDCGAPTLSCLSSVCKGLSGYRVCSSNNDCAPNLVCASGQCAPSGLEADTNRPGNDYTSFDMAKADPSLCRSSCEADSRCVAFTYVKPNSIQGPKPRCWLKSKVPGTVTNICCVSGTVLRIWNVPLQRQLGISKLMLNRSTPAHNP